VTIQLQLIITIIIIIIITFLRKKCGSIGLHDRQYAYKRNIDARSLNHFCSRKPVNITYSGSVCVALVIHHPLRMSSIMLSSVACMALTYFSTLSNKVHDFRKNVIEQKLCALIFTTAFLFFKHFSL